MSQQGILSAGASSHAPNDGPAVVADHIEVSFGRVRVLEDLDMEIRRDHTVGLVGESGSGKSTLGKAIVGINPVRSGSISVFGRDIRRVSRRERASLARIVQYIPQDPYSSLSPRRTIKQTLTEALDPRRGRATGEIERIEETLRAVGLDESALPKYPHEFSGGQRQRIAIARALLLKPKLIVADEITSALDVSVQSEIIQLLKALKTTMSLTMMFISHNLAVVEDLCDDVIVMRGGAIVEQGTAEQVFRAPRSEYTRELLMSVPGSPGFSLDGD